MSSILGRLLLVEDDPHDVELIQLALEPLGFAQHMDVVSDGEQALQYLGIWQPHPTPAIMPQLVLLDLKLPKVNGLQVLQRIRQTPQTRRLVVVVMTSSQEDADINSCYSLGINSYVVKPIAFQHFLEIARSVSIYWLTVNKAPLFSAG